jgi:hypothetical protein
VMMRRLHSLGCSLLASGFLSNVRTQISNKVVALRDRLSELTASNQEHAFGSPARGISGGAARSSRTSSQSSASGSRAGGYNLRSRPVHSTPRDQDGESQRKTTGTYRTNQQTGDIDEEDNDNDDGSNKTRRSGNSKNCTACFTSFLNKAIRAPFTLFESFWTVLKALPWWLLVPLLLLFAIYTCKHRL